MSTGFMQRFNAKIKVGSLWLGRGGFADALSGVSGLSDFIIKVPLPVTATANTDFTVTLPAGGALLNATVYTTTAYGAATDCKIQMGVSAGDATYVSLVSIKAIGVVPLTLLQPAAAGPSIMPAASPNLFFRLVQTGTTSATGAAFLVLNYTAQ